MTKTMAVRLAGLLLGCWAWSAGAQAAGACAQTAGRFVAVQGQVEVGRGGEVDWQAGALEQLLCQGDTIRVGPQSRASVSLINDAVLSIGENSTLRLIDIAGLGKNRSWLELVKGALQSFSRKPRVLTVNTPYLNGSIEGTEFVLRVEEGQTRLTVMEGTVVAANDQGQVPVPAGNSAVATVGRAPQARINVRPRDDAQWALYYPPVLAAGDAPAGAQATLRQAAELLRVGQAGAARQLLAGIPEGDPAAGGAHALRSVIAVVQNDRQEALAQAEKAVAMGNTASAAIALSYAQQANFRIESARDTLRDAVARYPQEALVWARLGELELMLGQRAAASEAARRAEALAPNLARTQLVLGFSALAEYRNGEAKAAFGWAIALESADPLAHLGLGLALISDGSLAAGRGEIEVAAGLDGSNALLRAYQGKAYFAEGRSPLDAEQFAVARELDPNDPTPWFYEGLLLQTLNRPVEAVRALEESRARNDNRAVYRGRLLLDQDQAARDASQARAYGDLGFEPLAISAASESLVLDPANAAAHRFLADSYRDVRRREIARVSEVLQSQLLQEVNLNPIQPSGSESNLNLVGAGGPASAGYNEFNALFHRNQARAEASVWGGTQSTLGGEVLGSAQYGPWSLAAGAFGYDTDGWRPNNGLNHQIYTLFGQVAVSQQLNLQVELRHRESTEGDLAFNFDPEDFIADKTVRREQDVARLGLRYSPAPGTQWLFSYLHAERHESLDQFEAFGPFTFDTRVRQRDLADQFEVQYLRQLEGASLVVGAAHIATDRTENGSLVIGDPDLPFPLELGGVSETEFRQPRGYAYLNLQATAATQLTVGLSGDQYEEGDLHVNSLNPKLGVRWQPLAGLQLRAAAFKTVKPALVNNRTIEPTQVAGFNQFFDDINGTKSWRYAAAADWRASPHLAGGVEVSARQLEEPLYDEGAGAWRQEDRHEQLHRLYLLWSPTDRLAVRGELAYDRYRGLGSLDPDLPDKVDTVSLPVGVRYFHPAGYFAGATVTGVRQRVARSALSAKASGEDSFMVADAMLGYRFPGGRGALSLAVLNLFDAQFKYQDDSFREFRDEPSTGPYFPVRTVMFRLGLSF